MLNHLFAEQGKVNLALAWRRRPGFAYLELERQGMPGLTSQVYMHGRSSYMQVCRSARGHSCGAMNTRKACMRGFCCWPTRRSLYQWILATSRMQIRKMLLCLDVAAACMRLNQISTIVGSWITGVSTNSFPDKHNHWPPWYNWTTMWLASSGN